MPATPKIQLAQVALQISNDIQERTLKLKNELAEMEQRKLLIEAHLSSAQAVRERSRNYRSEIGGNFQCPSCWVRNETEVSLTPIPSNTKDDLFRCVRCSLEVEIQMV